MGTLGSCIGNRNGRNHGGCLSPRAWLALAPFIAALALVPPTDASAEPTLDISDATAGEADGSIEFTVAISGTIVGDDVTVDYATSDGTATAGSDYTAVESGTLTFASGGQTEKTVTVTVTDDQIDEGDEETFELTLSNADNAALSGGGTTLAATGRITDDDTRGIRTNNPDDAQGEVRPSVNWHQNPVYFDGEWFVLVPEDARGGFKVRLTSQPTADVTVAVSLPEKLRTYWGRIDTSEIYSLAWTSLTFTPDDWDEWQNIRILAGDDDWHDAFGGRLRLDFSGGDYDQLPRERVPFLLQELEDHGPNINGSPSRNTQDLAVEEGGSATYTISPNHRPMKRTWEFRVVVPSDSDVSVDTDPNQDGDQHTVEFDETNWDQPRTVTVTAAEDDDAVVETVTLGTESDWDRSAGGVPYQDVKVRVNIQENEQRGVEATPGTLDVTEGGSGEAYDVKLTSQPTADVTVTVGGATGEVTVDEPTLTFTPSNWRTAQTVTVTAAEDADTASETVTLTHTADGGDYDSVSGDSVQVTVVETTVPVLSVEDAGVAEDAGAITFTVTLSVESSKTVQVDYATSNGTATAGSDYTAVTPGTLTFSAGDPLSQTVTVPVTDDRIDEADETFTLTLSNARNAALSDGGATLAATGTITDDDTRGVTVSPTTLRVDEGSGAPYTVVLESQPTADVTVTVSGATSYMSIDKTALTFTPSNWQAEQTVTVSAALTDDALGRRPVTLTHTVAGGDYESESADPVQVTYVDTTVPVLSVDKVNVAEDAGTLAFQVLLNVLSAKTVEVDYAISDGTATAGSDYTAVGSGTLTFAARQNRTTVTVEVTDDRIDEADETLTLTLSNARNAALSGGGATLEAIGTITDDDTRGVTLSPTTLRVDEDSSAPYTVVLESQPTADVTVTVGGAIGELSVDTETLTFTPSNWQVEQTVRVSAADDDDAVVDPAVTLTHLVRGGDYDSEDADSVEVTINENDTTTVSVNNEEAEEGAGAITFTVTLSVESSETVQVDYATSNGTATAGSDYTAVTPGTLTFSIGDPLSQTVTVPVTDDRIDEADETFTLTLSNARNAALSGGKATLDATGTITDDDTRGVTVSPTTLRVDEGSGAPYTVVLESQPTADVTVTVSGATSYVSVDKTALTFTPSNWQAEQTVTVSAADDDDAVVDPAVTLTHLVRGGDYDSEDADSVEVTINENDTTTVSVNNEEAEEGAGAITFTVTLSVESSETVQVDYATSNGTATAGSDYTAVTPGTLTFSIGDPPSQTVTVPVTDDRIDEADETFTLTLSNARNAALSGGKATLDATGTITDDDTRGVTVSPTTLRVDEGSSAPYTVVLESQPTADVTVTVSGATSYVSVDKTALTFTPSNWQAEQTVTVSAADDDAVGRRPVTLTHTVAGGDYGSEDADSVEVTINENDTATVSVVGDEAEEGAGPITFTVTLSVESSETVQVDYATSNGTATAGSDYTAVTPGTLTFSVGGPLSQTVTVPVTDDRIDEADETFTLTLSNARNTALSGGGATLEAIGTIIDDDTRGVTVSPTTLRVDEGSSAPYTVVLESQPTADVTVTVSGATPYVSVDKTVLTFTPSSWQAEQTVTVSAADDDDAGRRPVTLTHTVAGGDYGSEDADSVEVTINDNDTTTVSVDDEKAEEGAGTIRFTVTLSVASSETVQVDYATSNGTATAGSDYTAVTPGTLTFSVGGPLSQTVTVPVTDDRIDEADETFTLTLSNARNATLSGGRAILEATGTITDDDTRGVTVSPTTLRVDEGSSAPYTVVLESQPTADVTVTVSGATSYVSVDKTALTFTPSNWQAEQTVTVSAADDDAVGRRPVTLAHTVAGGDYGSEDADSVEVTINEDDSAAVTLAVSPSLIQEGAGESTLTVTAAFADGTTAARDIEVNVSVGGGTSTAMVGTDYAAVPDFVLTIAAGETSGTSTFRLTPVADMVDEPDETVQVTGVATGIAVTGATFTITDRKWAVSIVADREAVEEGESATFTLTRAGLVAATPLTVMVDVTGAGAVGPDRRQVSFAADATTAGLSVSTHDDDVYEPRASVTAVLDGDGGHGYVVAEPASATVLVLDNDAAPILDIAGASALENARTMDFTVRLAAAVSHDVTVAYRTEDVTAKAGQDYAAASSTLRLAPGQEEATIRIVILDDTLEEEEETFRVVLSQPLNATLSGDFVGTGTIVDDDHAEVAKAWLARFGRTVTGQMLDAVEARLGAARSAGARASLAQTGPDGRGAARFGARGDDPGSWTGAGGGREPETRAITWRELFPGSSFALTGGSSEGGGYTSLWGRGAMTRFDGREGSLSVDGEVTTGFLGTDWAAGRWTGGLVLGHSRGSGSYDRKGGTCEVDDDDTCASDIEATLTGIYPYAGVGLTDRLSAWAAAGYGGGEVRVTPEGRSAMRADLSMSTGAAGMRSEVLRPEGGEGLALSVKGDVRYTRISSNAVRSDKGNLEAADADVWLVRAGLESSRRFALRQSGESVTPSFEVGLRLDGGDAETGMGADFGGGLVFADPDLGLSFEPRARALVTHEADGFREWGASLSASWDPRPSTDRGLSLSLRQSWGASPTGGMDALLGRETHAGLAPADDEEGFRAASRLEADVGYGLALFGGAFTGTPNLGFGLSESARHYRLGWRLTSEVPGDADFVLSLEATRNEAASGHAPPEHRIMLRGALRW